MSDEIPPPMPPQPKTVEIAKPSTTEIQLAELLRVVKAGFADVDTRFEKMDANVELVTHDLGIVKDRVTLLEDKARQNSLRAQSASQVDMAHESQLADEIVARKALAEKVDALTSSQATQTAILTRLDKIASNPLVKTVAASLGTAVLTYLATHYGVHP